MKCFHIEARDIPDCWFQLVDLCYREGRNYLVGEGSYAGSEYRRELDYITAHITHPQTRPLLPEIPPGLGIPDPVPEGMDYINRYLDYIMSDNVEPGEQYSYGSRIYSKIDGKNSQIDELIEKYKRCRYGNNQCSATIAIPSDIHLSDPPCWRHLDTRIFEGEDKLHFYLTFRSWDLWAGFPANLAAIAHLQEYMASEIGVEPGEFVCNSKGLHLYSMYFKLAEARLRIL